MKVLAILSQKGGSGKTTIAVHTAVAAMAAGERVVLVDTDPQGSASTWRSAREADEPAVAPAGAAELSEVLDAARTDGRTLCIVDTAPHAAPDAARVAAVADFVLVTCRPTAFDLATVGNSVRIVQAANVPGAILLSACRARSPEVGESRSALADCGFPVAPVEIGDRQAYARAVASGRSVTEFDSGGKAADEVRQLWIWLKEQMK